MSKGIKEFLNDISVRGVYANNSLGTSDQVLKTDGSKAYWGPGDIGDTGYTGSQGITGYTGSKGDIGNTGSQGIIGYTGSQGITGYTGSRGYTGSAPSNVWTSDNDGPGSTLDADLLDGLHSNSFVQTSGNQTVDGSKTFISNLTLDKSSPRLGIIASDNTSRSFIDMGDSNSIFDGQIYYDNTSLEMGFRTSGAVRLLMDATDITYNGNDIWHAGNDGSGSGLDADLLDGFESSDFVRKSVINSGTAATKITSSTEWHQLELYRDPTSKLFAGSVVASIGSFIGNNTRYYSSSNWRSNAADVSAIQLKEDAIEFNIDSGLTPETNYTPTVVATLNDAGLDVNGDIVTTNIRVESTGDAALSSTAHGLQVGSTSSINVIMDGNEIMARNNGAASTLSLNFDGGDVNINGGTAWHSANDGSGSGLDADLWDGNQFSSFLNQSVTTGSNPIFNSVTATAAFTSSGLSDRDKLRVWSSSVYTIGMDDGYTYGGLTNKHAMTFQMNNDSGRGFWWGDDAHTNAQGAMSLTTDGKLTLAHSARIGYGESDTTIPGQHTALEINGSALLGDSSSTNGVTALKMNYITNESVVTFGSNRSTSGAVIGYAVEPSQTASFTMKSSVDNVAWKRAAFFVDGDAISYRTAVAQTTAVGTDIPLTNVFSVSNEGALSASTILTTIDKDTLHRHTFRNTGTGQTDLNIGAGSAANDLYIGTNYSGTSGPFIDARHSTGFDLRIDGNIKATLQSNHLEMSVPLARTAHNTGHLEGSYNNVGANGAQTNPIYTIGSGYNPAATTLGNMYGIGYSQGNASFLSHLPGTGWGMYVASDGDARIFLDAQNGQISSTGAHYVDGNEVLHEGNQNFIEASTSSSFISRTATTMNFSASANGGVNTGGWARQMEFSSGSTSTPKFAIGALGSGDTSISFGFLSANDGADYTDINALRIYPTEARWGVDKIWHAGNDGSGSGLDADLLDGLNSTDFLRTGISGQTIYGRLIQGGNDAAPGLFVGYGNRSSGDTHFYGGGSTTSSAHFTATNFNINTPAIFNQLATFNDPSQFKSNYRNESALGIVSYPSGGAYSNSSSSQTGAIKVRLPVLGLNSMMSMRIRLYNYVTNESFEAIVSGYFTASNGWARTSVDLVGNNCDYTVRFGHDGVGGCIWIGETTTVWQYPRVVVSDFLTGHSSNDSALYKEGWAVSLITSFDTIGATHNNNQLNKYINGNDIWHTGNDGSGSGLDADTLDGFQGSQYLRSDANDTATALTFTNKISFGSSTRQMIDLFSTSYAIGVQSSTLYYRSGGGFAWHKGGSHAAGANDPGTGGTLAMTLDGASNLTVTGDVTGYSDIKFKEDIVTIDDALNSVTKMRGVSFTKKKTKERSSGVIAQELENIAPELVHTSDDGIKSVAYGNITGYLIEAIKELNKKVEDLQSQLN